MPTVPAARQEVTSAPLVEGSVHSQPCGPFKPVFRRTETSFAALQSEMDALRQKLEARERELARSREENETMRAQLGRTLERLPCGLLMVGASLQVRHANAEALRLMSLSRDWDTRDKDAGAASIPPDLGHALQQILAAGKPFVERAWFPRGDHGAVVGVICASDGGGAAGENAICGEGSIFILRETTAQRRLERERERARRIHALAGMTAVLAHEIRNPLASMELFAELIRNATRDHAEVSQWIVHLQAGQRALAATVNNVLQFYTQAPIPLRCVEAAQLLADTMEFLQPLALQRSVGIEFERPAGEVTLLADPHRLQQVFFNLAINAFRAMAPGQSLKIRLKHSEGEDASLPVQIEFEDGGAGIPPENLARVFEAGYTTQRGSPGLGLAVCKRVVEQHGGTIQVASVPGRGTRFTLCLPAQGAKG